jgi:chaperonin GroEL (HSP60 family)
MATWSSRGSSIPKVARLALLHAASVAGLLLTTEVTAVEAPTKKARAAPPGPADMDEEF